LCIQFTLRAPEAGFARGCRLELAIEAPTVCVVAVSLQGETLARVPLRTEACLSITLPEAALDTTQLIFDVAFVDVPTEVDAARCQVAAIGLLPFEPTMQRAPSLGISLDDFRTERPDSLSDRDLMLRFASLGDNCELGIAQRQLEIDPLDLMRFSSVPLRWILFALDDRYARIDVPELNELTEDAVSNPIPHWYAYQSLYRIPYATGIAVHQQTHAGIHRDTVRRFQFMSKKFLKELETGKRIFLFRRDFPIADEELAAAAVRFRRFGGSYLVAMQEADAAHPAGTVESVFPGVLRAYIDKFADARCVVETVDTPKWVSLCRAIYQQIWTEDLARRVVTDLPSDFNPSLYLDLNSDVAAAAFDARMHYLIFGQLEGRRYKLSA